MQQANGALSLAKTSLPISTERNCCSGIVVGILRFGRRRPRREAFDFPARFDFRFGKRPLGIVFIFAHSCRVANRQ